MRIIADDNIPYLRGRLESVADVEYVDQFGFTPELVKGADALVIRTRTRCDRDLLDGSGVKLIATATIGTDQIDIPWCEKEGITVRNAPGCNAPAVAQYVWSSLLRMGFDPTRHTVGVIGCGNVGSIVADWGRRLGAGVVVSDPPKEEAGVKNDYASLEEILKTCDAITLHTPLTHEGEHATFHLIGEREFGLMKPGTLFVNAARGGVVDFKALKGAVLTAKIRATIDTWEGEPTVDEELLRTVDYGTFHIAGYSRQGKERATRMALEAIEDTFGITTDKEGLEGIYIPKRDITMEKILASYDPREDSEALKAAPGNFDTLRRNYHYREEL